MAAPLRLVVAGGIGSGKSTLGNLLAERGFAVLDADRVGHQILDEDNAASVAVRERWPEAAPDGLIDRSRLARIVFDEPTQLAELEALVHPLIRTYITQWTDQRRERAAAVELSVNKRLVDDGWVWVVVDTTPELRWHRLRHRGMSDEDIAGRLAAQPDRDDWLSMAHVVLDNTGTVGDLADRLDRTLADLDAATAQGR